MAALALSMGRHSVSGIVEIFIATFTKELLVFLKQAFGNLLVALVASDALLQQAGLVVGNGLISEISIVNSYLISTLETFFLVIVVPSVVFAD
jgi:hypothetical protein